MVKTRVLKSRLEQLYISLKKIKYEILQKNLIDFDRSILFVNDNFL